MVFLLPFLAVLLSVIMVFIFRPTNQKVLKLLLAFSGAFLLAMTLFELLPEVYQATDFKTSGLFILLGILLQIILEFASKGAEHGHMHVEMTENKFPLTLFLSLSAHALIEGLPLIEGESLVYAVLIHKLPIALILCLFLLNSGLSHAKVLTFMLLFAVMTPLGSFLSQNLELFATYSASLKGLAAGMFFHVSTTIIYESSQNHSFNIQKLMAIVLGMIAAFFI